MTTTPRTLSSAPDRAGTRPTGYPAGGLRFDWITCALAAVLMFGAYLDGWAHNNLSADLETFFTPWHAVLYGGVGINLLFFGALHVRNMLRGYRWGRTLPEGYHLSLIGAGVFALSGAADAIWHTTLGIEFGFDAAVSPPHLLGALAFVLTVSGALRSVWARRSITRRAEYWPAAVSLGLTLSGVTVIAQILIPLTRVLATGPAPADPELEFTVQALGFAMFLIHTLILMTVLLLAVKRWGRALPFGAFTLALAINSVLMAFQVSEWRFIPAMILVGLAADALRFRLDLKRTGHLRLFAVFIPVLYVTLYFVVLLLTDSIWWRVHTITGAVAASGAVGFALSLLAAPPPIPAED